MAFMGRELATVSGMPKADLTDFPLAYAAQASLPLRHPGPRTPAAHLPALASPHGPGYLRPKCRQAQAHGEAGAGRPRKRAKPVRPREIFFAFSAVKGGFIQGIGFAGNWLVAWTITWAAASSSHWPVLMTR
jgi:hypothetical protein